MEEFEIFIGSPENREFLVSHIFYQDVFFAEITQETGETMLHFYCCQNKYWEFPFDKILTTIERAKNILLGTDLDEV